MLWEIANGTAARAADLSSEQRVSSQRQSAHSASFEALAEQDVQDQGDQASPGTSGRRRPTRTLDFHRNGNRPQPANSSTSKPAFGRRI
jgi:hypothetical protein